MIVVALLPDLLLGRLRTALGADSAIVAANSLDEPEGIAAALRRGDVDLIVLDPGDRRLDHRARTLAALLAQYAAIPVVLYTSLTTTGVARAAELLRDGTRQLLIAGVEDQPGATRALAVRMTMDASSRRQNRSSPNCPRPSFAVSTHSSHHRADSVRWRTSPSPRRSPAGTWSA